MQSITAAADSAGWIMSAPEKMSDEQIAGVLGFSVMTPNAIAYLAMGRAIEAARDAQWQARLDAAVKEEREACAEFVDKHGHPNDWPRLGRAIRTRTDWLCANKRV